MYEFNEPDNKNYEFNDEGDTTSMSNSGPSSSNDWSEEKFDFVDYKLLAEEDYDDETYFSSESADEDDLEGFLDETNWVTESTEFIGNNPSDATSWEYAVPAEEERLDLP